MAKPPDEGGVDRRVLDEEGIARLRFLEARRGRELGAVDHVDSHEAGMIKTNPQKILAQGIDWRFLTELKKELSG